MQEAAEKPPKAEGEEAQMGSDGYP